MNSDDDADEFVCPVTGNPCQGEYAHHCEEYGCARRAGLSPEMEETP